jgi:hypothetical protein
VASTAALDEEGLTEEVGQWSLDVVIREEVVVATTVQIAQPRMSAARLVTPFFGVDIGSMKITFQNRHTTTVATSSYIVDKNQYANSGAIYHITSDEVDKLVIWDKYNGGETVHTTNDIGMEITHIDKSFIQQPTLKLQLFNILHDPEATKNLVFINGFTLDNNVFLEIHH